MCQNNYVQTTFLLICITLQFFLKIAARTSFPAITATAPRRTRCVMGWTTVGTVLTSAPAQSHCSRHSICWGLTAMATDVADLVRRGAVVRKLQSGEVILPKLKLTIANSTTSTGNILRNIAQCLLHGFTSTKYFKANPHQK